MIKHFISHRGNINGRIINVENSPSYIEQALSHGYEVEIDVWLVGENFYLGHDEPQYRIEESFLENDKLWCHAKNNYSFYTMLKNSKIHCFWHQNDDFVLTSKGIPWVYPNKFVSKDGIWVLPELTTYKNIIIDCLGICSDYISRYR
jgi:hypothetical protein